jgi:hypothetical protein
MLYVVAVHHHHHPSWLYLWFSIDRIDWHTPDHCLVQAKEEAEAETEAVPNGSILYN